MKFKVLREGAFRLYVSLREGSRLRRSGGCARLRGGRLIAPERPALLKSGKHAIVLATNEKMVPEVKKLFQVSAGFL